MKYTRKFNDCNKWSEEKFTEKYLTLLQDLYLYTDIKKIPFNQYDTMYESNSEKTSSVFD